MSKKGQISIFIIITIIVVALLLFIVILSVKKGIVPNFGGYSEDVKNEFEDCLENKIAYAINNPNFVAQPNLLLAKLYLEQKHLINSLMKNYKLVHHQYHKALRINQKI